LGIFVLSILGRTAQKDGPNLVTLTFDLQHLKFIIVIIIDMFNDMFKLTLASQSTFHLWHISSLTFIKPPLNESGLVHRCCSSVRLSVCPSVAKMQNKRDFFQKLRNLEL